MIEGWWSTFAFTGLSLSLGGLVWLLLRDRERRAREKEKAFHRILREAREDGSDAARELESLRGREFPSAREEKGLEEEERRKE